MTTAVLLISSVIATTAAQTKSFDVRRVADSPEQARTGAVLATVSYAPFDDQANRLYDGIDYFYTVEDLDGSAVQISVHKEPVLGTIRLGFDDGDPLSANVDVAMSGVVVTPSTIPADGASMATILVTPRDSSGVALGTGLTLTLDTIALFPGVVGEIVDNSNGTYTIFVYSSLDGQGTVVVSVEGLMLVDQPTITYEFLALSTPQPELLQLIAEFQAIVDVDPAANEANELEDSIQHLQGAVSDLSKTPANRVDSVDEIKKAIEDLERAEADGLDAIVADDFMDRLASIARQLAQEAIADALAFGGDSQKIDEAMAFLSDGDTNFLLPDYVEAAADYKEAAKKAKEALGRSLEPIVHEIKNGIDDISNALDKGFDTVLADDYMDRLASIARELAVIAIDAAVAARGAPHRIDEGLVKLGEGDTERALPEYSTAAQKYDDAANKANAAAPGMTYDIASLSGPRADLEQIIAELQAIIDADPNAEAANSLANSIQELQQAVAMLP